MEHISRRDFLSLSAALAVGATLPSDLMAAKPVVNPQMKLGLVTYLWAQDWDLPTLLKNCQLGGFQGVELRCFHAHKVETNLSLAERKEVKQRFADSGIECVGYGANFEYHAADPAILQQNIDGTKEYIKLCADLGATGIKVKPNAYPKEVSKEKTNAQIAKALNEVGRFAKDYGQLVRVEVHGNETQELPNMKKIFDRVTEKSVVMCWNCNNEDLLPPGLEGNFRMVKKWLGDTTHIRELNDGNYPYQELFTLFKKAKYDGWILLEARTNPVNKVEAMLEQKRIFNEMIQKA